jgi:hypothetical protein
LVSLSERLLGLSRRAGLGNSWISKGNLELIARYLKRATSAKVDRIKKKKKSIREPREDLGA